MNKVGQADDVVGIVPAAGKGMRIAPMPCSKELFPVGFQSVPGTAELRPKVVSHYLLEKYRAAGITNAFIVIRNGKWDIPAYYGDGQILRMHLAYITIAGSEGPPDTVDRAYPFLQDKSVAFGFPDIIFGPNDVFVRLLQRYRKTRCDVALGLYRAHDCRAMDMIDVDRRGRVRNMVLKPSRTELRYTWLCAIWGARFSDFLHQMMTKVRGKAGPKLGGGRRIDAQGDFPIGAVLQAAVGRGMHVEGVLFPREKYIDIGTPASLVTAVRQASMHHANGMMLFRAQRQSEP